MSVQIERNTGTVGVMANFNILVNGDKVRKIKNQEIINLPIPDDGTTIQFTQFGAKTQKVQVENGDRLEISTTFLGTYGIFILIIVAAFLGIVFNNYVRIAVFLVYLITMVAVDGLMFRITKN